MRLRREMRERPPRERRREEVAVAGSGTAEGSEGPSKISTAKWASKEEPAKERDKSPMEVSVLREDWSVQTPLNSPGERRSLSSAELEASSRVEMKGSG